MSNNDLLYSHPPTTVEACSAIKTSRKRRKGIAAWKNWTREEIEALITLWEGNKILYVSLSDYKDEKSAAVKQIPEQLDTNEENFNKKSIQSYNELKDSTFLTEDELFGQVIGKSIAKTPDGEIKQELKIEIQQCILNAKRRAPKS